ncbi:response regulator transcription factor [Dactylosporangium sp. NPDC049140]|uniref:response regulator transcription factor n=1 Tax=Dactylosporangium sp. NPDC049140 TaxID=3155647 RepID=UPI0033CE96CC
MIRVLVVDDQALVRQGLRLILELAGFEVTEAGDGAAAIAAVDEKRPDVVLMDLHMPVLDGVEATQRIVAGGDGRRTPVIALTTFNADEHVVSALRAGAVGFLLKDVTSEGLADAVRRAVDGEPVMAPSVLARLMDHFAARPPRPPAPPAGVAELSERELEVLTRIGAGLSNAEIAAELVISMATVKTHVRHILAKLDVRDRAQAIVVAHEAGLRHGAR